MSERMKDKLFLGVLVYTTLAFLVVMFATLWEMTDMSYTGGWAKILYGIFTITFISGNLAIIVGSPFREEREERTPS